MNKSSKRFTIISGIYLFFLTCLLLTQPRSGYSATVGQVILYYALYIPLWAVTAVIVLIATKNADKKWSQTLFGQKTLFLTIILLVIVGFIFNLDYQKQTGCFVDDEAMLSPTKFILSIGSILLLSSGYYFSDTKFGRTLLIAEFAIWTFKTLYFSSSLDLILPGYFTMTCWTLRFALIVKTLNRQTIQTTLAETKTNR